MSEIEEKFYKTFGIEKKVPCKKCSMNNTNWNCKRTCLHNDDKEKRYPELTDRILLQLICLLSQATVVQIDDVKDYKHLRNNTLACCIDLVEAKELNVNRKNQIKHQVQTLFMEGKNDLYRN